MRHIALSDRWAADQPILGANLQLWYVMEALVIVSVAPVQPAAAGGMQRHPDVHWILPLQATDKRR